MNSAPVHRWISFEADDEERTWMFDTTFLTSRLSCIYGAGCQGVLDAPAAELAQGCCSYGAHFVDEDDVAHVVRAFVHLDPDVMQFHAEATADGFLQPADPDPDTDLDPGIDPGIDPGTGEAPTVTRMVDDACIFLNRPGFPGGVGCALHLGALRAGERPLDWKPNVCWQVPIRVEHFTDDNGHVVSRVRAWERRDWGDGGAEFAWWCSEADEAYVGREPVYLAARDELIELVGLSAYQRMVELVGSTPDSIPVEIIR